MWEQIQANKRRSAVLIVLMGMLLLLMGYVIGSMVAPGGGLVGLAVAGCVWAVLFIIAVTGGSNILLMSAHAREVQKADAPQLFNIVEEMAIAAGLPKRPKVYIMDTDVPNAFAVGVPDSAAVAVTSGLLMRLKRDELQGVIAHEIGHITNRDTQFMTLAGVMLAAIVILADIFLRTMFYSGRGQRRSSGGGRGGGQAQAILLLVAVVMAILAPLMAQLLYFACSRRREYLADASAARFTRYPEGLASALEKISAGMPKAGSEVSRAVAPMYIINPLKGSAAHSIFSTHPPTEERVRILRAMAGGAGFGAYESAYAKTQGEALIGQRALHEADTAALRSASTEPEKPDIAKQRDAVDILHRTAGFMFLTCACGLKIKMPPSFRGESVNCPRCNRKLAVPAAALAAATVAGIEAAESAEEESRRHQRKSRRRRTH